MKKTKLLSIGEALIDFIPQQTGCQVKDVETFAPKAGGAPANVAGAYVSLGGQGSVITQLGQDPFGDKIVEEMERFGIDTTQVARTQEANTALAFVSLQKDGQREFSFYRKPSADMLLQPEQIREDWFRDAFALHFCSVSLGNFPMKEAHRQAIAYARKNGSLISFDPNLRFPLWQDLQELKRVVWEFIPMADILKISDEELEFITGKKNMEQALDSLFTGNVKLILYTSGSGGADAYWKTGHAHADGYRVKAVDTTGAGDGFIGSCLHSLLELVEENRLQEPQELFALLTEDKGRELLDFSNRFCAGSVQEEGAMASYARAAAFAKK